MANRRCGVKVVGARIPRYDGIAHVTGRTATSTTCASPARCGRRRSARPSTTPAITGLDTSKAEAMPGVHGGDHLEGRAAARVRAPLGARDPGRRAAAREGRGALPRPADRARRGRGRGRARQRVDAIEVAFEERPALFDVRQAFDADAPKIHHGATGTRTSRARWIAARSARATSTGPSTTRT